MLESTRWTSGNCPIAGSLALCCSAGPRGRRFVHRTTTGVCSPVSRRRRARPLRRAQTRNARKARAASARASRPGVCGPCLPRARMLQTRKQQPRRRRSRCRLRAHAEARLCTDARGGTKPRLDPALRGTLTRRARRRAAAACLLSLHEQQPGRSLGEFLPEDRQERHELQGGLLNALGWGSRAVRDLLARGGAVVAAALGVTQNCGIAAASVGGDDADGRNTWRHEAPSDGGDCTSLAGTVVATTALYRREHRSR